jgi:uncharacterized protein
VVQSLAGKVVLITGASSGIGALTAKRLAEQGAIPVLTARSLRRMEELAQEMTGEHAVYEMDVRSAEQVAEVVAQVHERFGKIDVLLNNAGFGEFVRFEEASLAHFEQMMDVNYMGTVRCTREVLPWMRKAGSGHIVNVASLAGKIATAKSTGYAASKHAVLGFTHALRRELQGTGIAVSAVNPGPVDTPFFDRADPDREYVKQVKRILLQPEQVVQSILYVMESRRAEMDLPWTAAFGVRLVQVLPNWMEAIYGKWINQK